MQIYIARDGVEIGEYSRERVDELARAGELLPNDYYWQEGMPDWLLLKDLLASELWAPIPAPAPRPLYKHRLAGDRASFCAVRAASESFRSRAKCYFYSLAQSASYRDASARPSGG